MIFFGRLCTSVLLLVFITLSSANSANTSKELLGEALKLSNSINSNLTVEQRLEKYQKIQKTIEKILSDHAGTDEGISLLSGQKIGNFNYAAIQNKYISELIGYYDTVCVVSPSFKCIAFISLDQGVKFCRTAADFKTLDAAHKNIMNAVNIFHSQGAKKEYQNLSLDAYKQCLPSANVKNTAPIRDYFSSKLVPAFLRLGKVNQAKAIIQKLKNPYLKFVGVMELGKTGGKDISQQYIERLAKYLKTNLAPENEKTDEGQLRVIRAQRLSALRLKLEVLKQTSNVNESFGILSKTDVQFKLGKTRLFFRDKKWFRANCNATFSKEYFNLLIKVIDATFSKKLPAEHHTTIVALSPLKEALDSFLGIEGKENGPWDLDNCAHIMDKRHYGSTLKIYSYIRGYDRDAATAFLKTAAEINYDYNKLLDYLFEFETDNKDFKVDRVFEKYFPIEDDFLTFKRQVRKDDMCKAVKMIFKKFKGKDIYNNAISYLIDSPRVNREKKYDCGDAELEMLLKN